MTFDPSVLGLISTTGLFKSETIFTKNQNLLNVTSDGVPLPARVDTSSITRQDYNYNFVYRAGDNTQYPQESKNLDLGIFANGVLFNLDIGTKYLPKYKDASPVI